MPPPMITSSAWRVMALPRLSRAGGERCSLGPPAPQRRRPAGGPGPPPGPATRLVHTVSGDVEVDVSRAREHLEPGRRQGVGAAQDDADPLVCQLDARVEDEDHP